MIPAPLQAIAGLFAGLTDGERRELLTHYAAGCGQHAPRGDERFAFEDLRHDAECTDAVGIHLRLEDGQCRFRISMGPEVQTLTRALGAILCAGLDGLAPAEVGNVPESIIDAIAGATLMRLRSRTVYYMLRRMKETAARAAAVSGGTLP